jgi:hypothetical protein
MSVVVDMPHVLSSVDKWKKMSDFVKGARWLGVQGSSPDALQQRLIAGAFCEKLHVKFFLRDEAFVD